MLEKISNRKVLLAALVCVVYFSFLYLNTTFIKSDFVLIGVVQELLTIPFLLLQLGLFFIATRFAIRDQFSLKKSSFWSMLILLISNGLILCSLI